MADIWTLGTKTGIPDEFPGAWDGERITHRIGDGDTWRGFHPSPHDGAHGFREYPFTITFVLDHAPQGTYELRVDYLITKAGVPQLRADLNGYRVLAYLDVEMSNNLRERPNIFNATSGKGHMSLYFPASALRQGTNTLILTAVEIAPLAPGDEGRTPMATHGDGFGSGFHYDVLRFSDASDYRAGYGITLKPTPFYKNSAEHGLCVLFDVAVDFSRPFETAELRIDADSQSVSQAVDRRDYDSGQVHMFVAVPVPESAKEIALTTSLHIEGQGATELSGTVKLPRKWTLYLLPHAHLDIGFTDFQGKVAELHSRNLDRLLAVTAEHADYAFMADGSWIVQNFMQTRSRDRVAAVAELAKNGKLAIQAFYALFLTGVASLEECYRAAYLAGELAQRFGFTLDYANLTDVPAYSWALPSILAALDIPHFIGISNHHRSATPDSIRLHQMSPVRWQGPDGAEILTYFSHHYHQLMWTFGDPPMVATALQGLRRFLSTYERDDYVPDVLPIVGTHSDNEDLSHGFADIAARWNAEYAYPHIIFSNPQTYFAEIEKIRDQLPVVRGDGGSFWEDGVAAAARAMATYRSAQTALATGESLAALLAAFDPTLRVPRERLNDAWQGLLIGAEHTWTYSHVIYEPDSEQARDQQAWKEAYVTDAARVSRDTVRGTISQLAERLTSEGQNLIVYNPSSWPRTDSVEVDLPTHAFLTDVATGEIVLREPMETLSQTDPTERVRFVARDVPPLGYKVYSLSHSPYRPQPFEFAQDFGGDTEIETAHYTLRLDPQTGRIASLFDRETGRELADGAAAYGIGDYLYVSGAGTEVWRGNGPESNAITEDNGVPLATLPDLDVVAAEMRYTGVRKTAWGWHIRREGSAPRTPYVRSDIYLYDDRKRVDVELRFDKERVLAKEAVYIAFPFAFDNPTLHYDRQQGWVNPATDTTPGANHEWLCIQHAVDISAPGSSVTWSSVDAPLFTAGDIVRGIWPSSFEMSNGHIYSYVMNNYWPVNYPAAQEGHYVQRYSFTSGDGWNATRAARFGREARIPLARSFMVLQDKNDSDPRPLPADQSSFVSLTGSDSVIVAGIYGAQDERGMIVRLQDVGGAGGDVSLRLAHVAGLREAWHCTALERDRDPLSIGADGKSVSVSVPPYGVVSLRLIA